MTRAPRLHQLLPQRAAAARERRRAVGRRQVDLLREAARQEREPLLGRGAAARVDRLVAAAELCKRLLQNGRPQHALDRAPREARLPVGAARQPVVHQHHRPVVVGRGVLHEEADGIEPIFAVRRVDKGALDH